MKRKRSSAAEAARSRRVADLLGLALSFVGAACLLWLFWRQSAPVPGVLVATLRTIAGSGAIVAPLVLIFVGLMLLFGYERFSPSHASWGSFLAFLTFAAWRHLQVDATLLTGIAATEGPLGSYVSDPQWSLAHVRSAGGYVGAGLGWALSGLFGRPASFLFLVMFGLMALVLIVDKPFMDMVASLRKPARAGLSVARKGVDAVRNRNGSTNAVETSRTTRRAVTQTPAAALGPPVQLRLPGLLDRLRGRTVEDEGADEPEPAPRAPKQRAKPAPALQAAVEDAPQTPEPSGAPDQPPPGWSSYVPYQLPPTNLLKDAPPVVNKKAQQELAEKIRVLEQTLDEFGIGANVVEIAHGPTVTRYEIQLAPGIKVGRITSLADNLAMSLEAINVRVEAPIPGKSAIGVEVPNSNLAIVSLKECVENPEFRNAESKLTIALGKDVAGEFRMADLSRMPHLLIGGATNSGKSACLNSLIASIVYRARPDEVKFIMVDPKRVELSMWDGIPHLIHPVVKEVRAAPLIFKAAIREMDRRYDVLAGANARNIAAYNAKVAEAEKLPYLLVIVDELADLMAQAGPEIETSIERLAHLARATGIHLVIATQRPSVDVITGTIKANIPSRIAFACIQSVDSRTILDRNGAERLIGRGDMLFLPIDAAKPTRIQGCFLSDAETEALVEYLRSQDEPEYTLDVADEPEPGQATADGDVDDEMFEKCVRFVVSTGHASASMLQRRFRIGYPRASRIVDLMEQRGFVGPQDGAKLREVLISREQADRMFGGP